MNTPRCPEPNSALACASTTSAWETASRNSSGRGESAEPPTAGNRPRENPKFRNITVGYDTNADDDIADAGDDIVYADDFTTTQVSFSHDNNGNLTDSGTFKFVYDAWNRLVEATTQEDGLTVMKEVEYDAKGRRLKKITENAGDFDGTTVYLYDGWKIIETRDGSSNVQQQFIHGTQYIDELVMMRLTDQGDLYVHQGEFRPRRDERERAATGKAGRDACVRRATCLEGASRTRATGRANWNVIGLTDLGGSVVERYLYTPYGEPVVQQETGYGDRDGDGVVDSTDKGTPGSTCTGTVTGACRILDLDFDGDYDSSDATLFDSLTQGAARHPGRTSTAVRQPFGHQGLLYDAEIASYQNRHRQYDPSQRRFLQRDPLGRGSDSINLYSYTNQSPTNKRDATGLICTPCIPLYWCCDIIQCGFCDPVTGLQTCAVLQSCGAGGLGPSIPPTVFTWPCANLPGPYLEACTCIGRVLCCPGVPGGIGSITPCVCGFTVTPTTWP